MRLTWVLTVCSPTTSVSAISALDIPVAMCRSTSRSRSVRPFSTAVDAGGAGRDSMKFLISRRVMLGDSSDSLFATTRTARVNSSGSLSLSRNPLAPARNAA